MKGNPEPYEYHVDTSFGLRLAVTRSEFIFYRVITSLAKHDEISMFAFLVAQLELMGEGWTWID